MSLAAAKLYAVINNTNAPSIATHFARRSCSFIHVGSYSTNISFEKLLTLKGVSIMDGIQMVMLCILGLFAIMMYGTRRLGESVAFQR